MKSSTIGHRQNKTAKGFTAHYERREKLGRVRISNPKHPLYKEEKEKIILALIVRGTLDSFAKRGGVGSILGLAKKVKKEHPIDKGYFKEVYVISDCGKRRLRELKNI